MCDWRRRTGLAQSELAQVPSPGSLGSAWLRSVTETATYRINAVERIVGQVRETVSAITARLSGRPW